MGLVLVITGSYPPEICGVGEYTRNVMETRTAKGWKLYHRTDWRLSQLPRIIREIDALAPSQIFMQYPTQGYGWSLVPHLICTYYSVFRRARFTVVLHEFSQLSPKAKGAATVMVRLAHGLIFTSEFERAAATRVSASAPDRSHVVKIASNVPRARRVPVIGDRSFDMAYFGHIRPRKGIEDFLAVAATARALHPDWRLVLIGQIPSGFETFAQAVVDQCNAMKIETRLDLDSSAVAELLAQVKTVYLPFPDGISERRGTAMAAMANGVVVVTTAGPHTTPPLRAAVRIARREDALLTIERTISDSEENLALQQSAAAAYFQAHVPLNWDGVARAYLT